MTVIGIDIGTTTISAVVLDMEKKEVLESRTITNGCDLPRQREYERLQDADRIVEKARGVLDELLERHPQAERIGLTGQMHGMLYLDEAGRSVSPLYTWQDQSAGAILPEGRSTVEVLEEDYGLKASAGFGVATCCAHILRGAVPAQAVSICTIPDYLGVTLTGRRRALQHVSMAASMGCFDILSGRFYSEELERLGMDISMLPEVTGEFAVLGEYKGRSVSVAIGDNQASFLGSVGLEADTVLLNLGTGGQISVMVDEPIAGRDIESRPLTGDRFIAVGSSLSGGRAYAALEKFFRAYVSGEPQYDRMADLLEKEQPFTDPLRVVTAFNGSRFDPALRGSIANISEENFTPGNLIYGVLWGMCAELRGMFKEVEEKTGMQVRRLVGSGNGIRRNKALQDIARAQFGVELELAAFVEEAACGAAVSAGM